MTAPAVRATPQVPDLRGRPGARPAAAALAAAAVLSQIAYPLLSGGALRAATVLAVLLFAAASTADAAARWGLRTSVTLTAAAAGWGLAAEAVGVATGFPFGAYAYTGTLGPHLLGVPLLIPAAWTMIAYPCLLLGRRLAGRRARRAVRVALLGGLCLAAWDLFLDPQMVAAGHWVWAHPDPGLPGVPGIPLTNYAGWVLVAVGLVALLDRLAPAEHGASEHGAPEHGAPARAAAGSGSPSRAAGAEPVPAVLLGWTWAGSTLGNLAFFDRPWVALYGGLAMGALVLPYLLRVARERR